MKIQVIGGGPAGLYFAIADEEDAAQPRMSSCSSATVPTIRSVSGWCSPTRLSKRSRAYDRESYRADRRCTSPTGTTSRSTSRGPRIASAATGSAAARESTLLKILRPARARSGSRSCISPRSLRSIRGSSMPISSSRPTASIPACAETFADRFKPSVDVRPNFFSLIGSTRPFDAFTFFFCETEHGIFIRPLLSIRAAPLDLDHRDRSSEPMRAGLDKLDEEAARAFRGKACSPTSSRASADHQPVDLAQLSHYPLRTLGRRQCGANRRRQGDRAFLHRLLHQARNGGRDRAVRGVPFQRRGRDVGRPGSLCSRPIGATRWRRPSIRPTCHWSARACPAFLGHGPDPVRLGLMTRSKAITYDNLALRAPDFVTQVDQAVAGDVRGVEPDPRPLLQSAGAGEDGSRPSLRCFSRSG